MIHTKYADDLEIRDKIQTLFAQRQLLQLLEVSGLDTDSVFLTKLYEIQYSIYLLDAYLESTWELDPEILRTKWDGIYLAMQSIGYDRKTCHRLLKEIRQYEKIELNCRKNRWPSKAPFKRFYRIKSCDVRLIRYMIYEAAPILHSDWKLSAWTYYDMLTEITDDITDIQEDICTFNGNRFLISILRKGIRKTIQFYERKLARLQLKAERYFQKTQDKGHHEELSIWTQEAAAESFGRLKAFQAESNTIGLSSAWLLSKMK
jgi:hypothetical protein